MVSRVYSCVGVVELMYFALAPALIWKSFYACFVSFCKNFGVLEPVIVSAPCNCSRSCRLSFAMIGIVDLWFVS